MNLISIQIIQKLNELSGFNKVNDFLIAEIHHNVGIGDLRSYIRKTLLVKDVSRKYK